MKILFNQFIGFLIIFIIGCGSKESITRIPISTKSDEAKALFHKAIELNAISKSDKAKENLLRAINIDEQFGFAYLMLSTFNTNTVAETDEYYEKALSLQNTFNETEKYMLEIRTSYRENDTEQRLESSKKLLRKIPENAFAHLRMAYTYWEISDIEKSRKYLISAIDKDKYYGEAYSALIQNYLFGEPKSYEKAERYATKALSFNKNESYYHVALGDVYRAQNKLAKAAEKYDDAYNAGTDNWFSSAKAGHAYTMFNLPEARKRFDQAVRDARSTDQRLGPEYAKVHTYLHEDDFQGAYSQLEKFKNKLDSYSLSVDKKRGELSSILWYEYFIKSHSGEHEDAKKALEERKIIDLEIAKLSNNQRAIQNTESGYLWAESHLDIMKGNYNKAKEKLSRLREMRENESTPLKFDGYHNLMGMANLMDGDPQKSVEHFENVIDPSNIYFTYFKGLSYKASGEKEKAKKLFQEVATHNFNSLNYTVVRNRAINEIENI